MQRWRAGRLKMQYQTLGIKEINSGHHIQQGRDKIHLGQTTRLQGTSTDSLLNLASHETVKTALVPSMVDSRS